MTEESKIPDMDSPANTSHDVLTGDRSSRDEVSDAVPARPATTGEMTTSGGDTPVATVEQSPKQASVDVPADPSRAGDIGTALVSTRLAVRKMLVSASATAILQGGSGLMAFVLAVLLARFLGSDGYGEYA